MPSVVTARCSDCDTVLSYVLSYLGTSLGYRMFYFGIKKKSMFVVSLFLCNVIHEKIIRDENGNVPVR